MKYSSCSRRTALQAVLASLPVGSSLLPGQALRPPASQPAANPHQVPDDKLSAYIMAQQVWVRYENRLLTAYRAHHTQKYPYFYPLSGPLSGLPLTSESSLPWPHHRSCYFACDQVNGANYWQEGLEQGQIVSVGLKLGTTTADSVEILDRCEWRKPGAPVMMTDQRRFQLRLLSERVRTLDVEIQWTAVQDILIQKTNHALFSIRADMDLVPQGGGVLISSDGQRGEKETFGKTFAWACFYGPRKGCADRLVEGITLMDHPKNPWAPTPWFTRDYGFLSPMPFNFIEKPWSLKSGAGVTLRFRVVMHAGDPQQAGIADLYKQWIAS